MANRNEQVNADTAKQVAETVIGAVIDETPKVEVGRIALVDFDYLCGMDGHDSDAARYAWTAMAQAADFISRTVLPEGVAIALWDEADEGDSPRWAVVAAEGDGMIDATCGAVYCDPWLARGTYPTIEAAIAAAPKTDAEIEVRRAWADAGHGAEDAANRKSWAAREAAVEAGEWDGDAVFYAAYNEAMDTMVSAAIAAGHAAGRAAREAAIADGDEPADADVAYGTAYETAFHAAISEAVETALAAHDEAA